MVHNEDIGLLQANGHYRALELLEWQVFSFEDAVASGTHPVFWWEDVLFI